MQRGRRGSEVDLRGEGGAGTERERGDGIKEARARRTYPLPASVPVSRSGGDAPLFRPGSLEQGRETRQGAAVGKLGQVGRSGP